MRVLIPHSDLRVRLLAQVLPSVRTAVQANPNGESAFELVDDQIVEYIPAHRVKNYDQLERVEPRVAPHEIRV